jgi:cation diffusion facilitator CzcD-associated flavoprotein CzcO
MVGVMSRKETAPLQPASADLGVAILGAGFGGLCMAIKLRERGCDDFLILEQAATLGGTWRDNTYPGCGCDVPAHLYSYSFAQSPHWTRAYARQPEILAYLRKVAADRGIDRKIVFDARVTELTWDETAKRWTLVTADGWRFTARVVVSAVGGLHVPKVPPLPGLTSFQGPAFHSARWRHDVEFAGKHVAVIGTGASAIQIIPAIAPQVTRLTVYQRTPPWVLPRRDEAVSPAARWAYARVPGLLRLKRAWHYWRAEALALGLACKPKLMGMGQKASAAYKEREIADPELRLKLNPFYTLGCKRILISDDFYAAMTRPNVELVTEPIREVRPTGVVAGDVERPSDVLVFATGFDAFNASAGMSIQGRAGRSLAADWADGPEAYLGVAVTGYPNLFLIMGPNSGLGHNSIVFMIEAQVRYILGCLDWLAHGRLREIEVRPEVQRAWNESLRRRFRRTVWQDKPGGSPWQLPCTSWYVNARGRNTTLWPGLSAAYWLAMRRPRPADYLPAADVATSGSASAPEPMPSPAPAASAAALRGFRRQRPNSSGTSTSDTNVETSRPPSSTLPSPR